MDASTPSQDTGKLKIGGVPQSGVRTQRGGQGGRISGQGSHIGTQGPGGQGNGAEYNLVPLAGIQISAGSTAATSDKNGVFLLRDLPAGDVGIAVVPIKTPPESMKVPTGTVHMPPEPIEVQGATIVISNPDLVPYLVGKTADEVRDEATHEPSPAPQPAKPPHVPSATANSKEAVTSEAAPSPALPAPVPKTPGATTSEAAPSPTPPEPVPASPGVARPRVSSNSVEDGGGQCVIGPTPPLAARSCGKAPITVTNSDSSNTGASGVILLPPLTTETEKKPQDTDKKPK